MKDMILEPYSVGLNFKMGSPMSAAQWGSIISELAETLARRCSETGPCVIGHIKGFAGTPGNGFLKVSVISCDHPADVDAEGADDFSLLTLTLNVLVYGHSKKLLAQITQSIIDHADRPWSGHVTMTPVEHGNIQINESRHRPLTK